MMRMLYKIWFKLISIKFDGSISPDIPKFIIIVAPHTSNKDFFIGLAVRSILRIKTNFLAKSSLFKAPFGFIFRWLGGYPVDRSRFNRLVEAVVDIYDSKERFSIAIAPEGTRKKVKKLKAGFYHISRKANIPIIMIGFDLKGKTIQVSEPFHPSNNVYTDFKKIIDFFSACKGYYPENGIDSSVLDSMSADIERLQKGLEIN
jgi:1-acyl-sn-glycerol-3-phosphate acyltransferase